MSPDAAKLAGMPTASVGMISNECRIELVNAQECDARKAKSNCLVGYIKYICENFKKAFSQPLTAKR
jgi:hypothetical protein